MTNIEGQSI